MKTANLRKDGKDMEKEKEELLEKQTPETEEADEEKKYIERKRWLFLGLPFTFTKYTVNEEVITINTGLLSTKENDCYLYKVQDVELITTLAERLVGVGTIACYTGDNTHPQLFITHVKHAKEIKDFILHASEKARRKRRTMNTLNIDAADIEDGEF